MFPILLSIGPISIQTFGIFLVIAFILGAYVIWHYGREDAGDEKILDFILVFAASIFLFARLCYILFYPQKFENNILRMLHLINFPGAIIEWGLLFGFFISVYFTIKKKINTGSILDITVLGLGLAVCIGELGCFLSGCTLGLKTNSVWGLNYGNLIGKRYPVSLYSYFLLLAIVILVFFLIKRKLINRRKTSQKQWDLSQEGLIAAIFFFYFGLVSFLLEFIKEGSVYLLGFKPEQIADAFITLFSLIFLLKYINWQKVKFKTVNFLLQIRQKIFKR